MAKHSIKLAIVDDHPLIIEGLKNLLQQQSVILLVGTFGNGQDLLDFLSCNEVDVVLLDISLPDISGIDLCLEIKKITAHTFVIGLSNYTERSIIMGMLQNGASGYLLKSMTVTELAYYISEAAIGKVVFSEDVQKIIAMQSPISKQEIAELTRREFEILRLIASGKTAQNIADELFLSKLTVETHRKNLLVKFKAKNVAELVKMAVIAGFI
jgi:DNA-binding NarL/FixJ family response regulator